jgi:hypothetical protein
LILECGSLLPLPQLLSREEFAEFLEFGFRQVHIFLRDSDIRNPQRVISLVQVALYSLLGECQVGATLLVWRRLLALQGVDAIVHGSVAV